MESLLLNKHTFPWSVHPSTWLFPTFLLMLFILSLSLSSLLPVHLDSCFKEKSQTTEDTPRSSHHFVYRLTLLRARVCSTFCHSVGGTPRPIFGAVFSRVLLLFILLYLPKMSLQSPPPPDHSVRPTSGSLLSASPAHSHPSAS